MNDLDHTLWQGLMNEAYKPWKQGKFKSYNDMIEKVPKANRIAVLLGNLNYQVCNGGWAQWVDNGYGLRSHEVRSILVDMGTTNARKVYDMIGTFMDKIDFDKEDRGCDNYWLTETCPCCDGDGDVEETCHACDGSGYTSDDDDAEECSDCRGSGNVETTCSDCGGDGTYYSGGLDNDGLSDKYYSIMKDFQEEVETWLLEMAEPNTRL